MGQSDIIQFLKRSDSKWFNASEISDALNTSASSVLACLRRLRKSGLVEFKNKVATVKTTTVVIKGRKFKDNILEYSLTTAKPVILGVEVKIIVTTKIRSVEATNKLLYFL